MKNLITNIIIAIVCFTLGYMFYPSINETNINPILTNEKNSDENIQSNSETVKQQKIVTESINDRTITNTPEQLANIVEETEVDEINTTPQVSSEIKDKAKDEGNIVFQTELEEWSAVHKEQINELISAHMSGETAEHMKLQILKDNEFLSKPPINQDPIEDENWAYNMEQQLKLLISQHELSDSFELLNLSCKQLLCDILGVEKDGNTWFKLYINLLQTAPNAEFPDGNNDPKSVQYMEGDIAVIYSQIRFKSS
jgi:hypothetical protein